MASLKQFALSAAILLGVVGQAVANPLETAAEPAELAARSEGDLYSADSGLMAMKRDDLLNSVVDGLVARFAEDEEVQLALRGKSKSTSCKKLRANYKKLQKANKKLLGKKAKKSKKSKKSKKAKKGKKEKKAKSSKKSKKDKKDKKHKKAKKEKKEKDDEE